MEIFNIKEEISNISEVERLPFFADFFKNQNDEQTKLNNDILQIIKTVQSQGDRALLESCRRFDKADFTSENDLIVSIDEIQNALKTIDKKVYDALKLAYKRIYAYHKKQLPKDFFYKDKSGCKLGNIWKNIESVGVYAPGGTASYPSSVLMSAIPALVAGVKNIVLCCPTSQGKLNEAVLVAAHLCNIKKIYKVGGAHAIAALCYGTKTIDKVNKIVGPGNSYVTGAKKILYGEVGIDMIAGPTDVTIICDANNNPAWIAADALSQLEHGPDSKAFIITDNLEFANLIIENINILKQNMPRLEIIEKSLKNSAIFVIKNIKNSVHIANFIAPEHLQICTINANKYVDKIQNAGAIFLGHYSPESIGDYIAGPSHTLPTSSSAKFSSGLSVYDFLKRISLISCNKKSFKRLSSAASVLAASEGLPAHKLSIDIRNEK